MHNDTAPAAKPPLRIRVSAPGTKNPRGYYRDAPGAKMPRRWTKSPVVVEVVDDPKGEDQISPATFAALQADVHGIIRIEFLAGDLAEVAAGNEVAALKAKIAEQERIIEQLRADLASEVERLRDEARLSSDRAEEAGRSLDKARAEITTLRDQLETARAAKASRAR